MNSQIHDLYRDLNETIENEDQFRRLFGLVPPELIQQLLTYTSLTTLFLQACRKGAFNVCRLLKHESELVGIDVLAQIDTDPNRGGGPIHYATWEGHLDIIKWLLTYNHPNNTLTKEDLVGNTPILYAIYGGHLSLVKLLYVQMKPIQLNTLHNIKRHTAIIQAACGGHIDIIEWLLEQGCSLAEQDIMRNTPLLFAAWGGHLDAVKWMIAKGSSLTEVSETGHTALLSAANSGKVEVVSWLLEEIHISPLECNTNGDTALLLAGFGGHCELLDYLVRYIGPSFINQRNHDGLNVLLSACNGGSVQMVEHLITKYGLSLDECTTLQYTPLILAACGGHLELVQWLISHGCPIAKQTHDGDTAFLLACYCGHINVVEWLLEKGASLEEHNRVGLNALLSAANGGNVKVCELLILKGIQIDFKDIDGYTALLLATHRHYIDVVKLLWAYGADYNAATNTQANILDLARNNEELYLWIYKHRTFHHVSLAIEIERQDIATWCLYNGASINRSQLRLMSASATPITSRFIRQILCQWKPSTHYLFGPQIRLIAELLIKLQYRLQYMNELPFLPVELWDLILSLAYPR